MNDNLAAARYVLEQLGMPKGQRNERSGYTLLALLDLRPDQPWTDVSNPTMGVRPIMDWMAKHYGKIYAENSRESVRRFTLHQFIQAGLVIQNPYEAVAVNSSKNVYQVPAELVSVLRTYDTAEWANSVASWQQKVTGLVEQWAEQRELDKVSIQLPDGSEMKLTPGGQNPLIKAIVEEFGPRFAPGAKLLYLGDAGQKYVVDERDALETLNVRIDEHGKMPDVVLHDLERGWLFLIEAVTSHGPVDSLRKADLARLFGGSTAGLVYVTAFEDRATWLRYDVAWETEVWLANAPDHMVHFNGDRFLGPH